MRKGAKLFSTGVTVGSITFGEVGTTLDLDYLRILVLLRVWLLPTGLVNVRLLGGAVALSAGDVKLIGEGRYTFGLSNVSDLPFGGDVNNRAIYALVGLEWPLVP